MTRSRTKTAAVAVPLAAALAVVALLTQPDDDSRRLTVVVPQAMGLVEGSPVLVAGTKAGEVRRITLGPTGLPHVALAIDRGVRPRAGATADVRLSSNSGQLNRVVALRPGRGAPLPDGATLPARRATAPVELDDVLDALTPGVRDDVRHVVAQLDGATEDLDGALRRSLRRSTRAVEQTGSLLHAVAADGSALRTLVAQGRATSAVLADRRREVGSTVADLRTTLSTTTRRQALLRDSVRALPDGLAGPRRGLTAVRDAAPAAERLLVAARPGVRTLAADAPALRTTLRAATPLLARARSLNRTAPAHLDALGPLLTSLRPAVDRLTPTLHGLLPATDVLRVNTPELAGFLASWAGVETSYDAAGHGARMALSQGSIPNRIVGLDSNAPGYIPRPYLRTPGALVGQPWTDAAKSYLSREQGAP